MVDLKIRKNNEEKLIRSFERVISEIKKGNLMDGFWEQSEDDINNTLTIYCRLKFDINI